MLATQETITETLSTIVGIETTLILLGIWRLNKYIRENLPHKKDK